MEIVFDEAKRQKILLTRGLDFLDAGQVFDGPEYTVEDQRHDYPERRFQTMGYLGDRLVKVIWTPTETGKRIITMWKCNDREQEDFKRRMG